MTRKRLTSESIKMLPPVGVPAAELEAPAVLKLLVEAAKERRIGERTEAEDASLSSPNHCGDKPKRRD